MNDVANKPIEPLHVDEVVRVTSQCTVPPFGHKAIHGKINLILHGYKMNVIDPWVGETVAFSPTGDRCTDGLCYLGRW